MSDPSFDDARPPSAAAPDAHGLAAILLVESLIHGLMEKSIISLGEAVEIVDTAVQVSREVQDDYGVTSPADGRSTTLLLSISQSLRIDLPGPDR